MFDGPFLSLLDPSLKWSHEGASVMLFDAMLEEYPHIIIKKNSAEAKFVQCLIEGDHAACPNEKKFLFDIISNSRNSIDVDKLDYIQRDCR